MGDTTSDQVIQILHEAGIKRAYGVPGDATDLMLASIHTRDDFDFILCRHEEAAGFMASAHAKLTGEMGVILACQGPGSAHLPNAMYDAKLDKVPMLVLTGQIESAQIGTGAVQEINQILLFEDCTCFNREVRTAENLVDILQLAIQSALVHRSVAHVSIATDVLRKAAVKRMPSTAVYNMPHRVTPTDELLDKAADILNSKSNVTILYGGGTRGAVDELLQCADLLKSPIVHTVRSKEIVDNNNPHYAGGIGFKGSKNGCHFVKDCDALLIVGCAFAWREFYPDDVPIVQIDIDAQRIGVRCKVEVGLIGDAKLTLAELAPKLKAKKEGAFLQEAQKDHASAIESLDKEAQIKEGKDISSPILTHVISRLANDDAIFTVDAGTVSVWANNWLRLNGVQRLIGSTELGTLGFGMPAALGCQIAEPKKQVIALVGDGGFHMTMGDFATAIKYNLPIIVVIYNNFSYHFIELEQMKEGVAQCYTHLSNPDYAALAKAFGAEGFTITEPEQLEDTIQAAFSCGKPCIVDVHTRRDELIKPNKLTVSLVTNFMKGMIKTKLSKSND
ncbi:MAG: thiamine pyrophosphate-binding protein [Coxiellaceae bacterium]|nr:thiamine pyrophosphate-binding protein [Coxiellaceae bacterium]